MKRCPRCEATKPVDNFYPSKTAKDGCAPYCKPCSREYKRQRDKRRREEFKSMDVGDSAKECVQCGEIKLLTSFNISPSMSDGRDGKCRDCANKYQRRYYEENKEAQNKAHKIWQDKRIEQNHRLFLEYISNKICTDCGMDDTRVLEFDHVRGKKKWAVSLLVNSGRNWEKRVLPEMEKCEIVCANCHKIRTGEKFGWFRETHHNNGGQNSLI